MGAKSGRAGRGVSQRSVHAHPSGDARVLYIHPAKQGIDVKLDSQAGRAYGLIPVGVPALVNLLRLNGIEVRGLNYPLERQLNPAFNLKNWLRAHDGARAVLIDLHWYEHCYGAISVARAVRTALPEAWTVLGGLTASGFSNEILENFPVVDFVIRGDAERPLLALVQRLLRAGRRSSAHPSLGDIANLSYRDGRTIVENEATYTATAADLDALNFADLSFLEHRKEYYVNEYIVTDLQAALQALETSPYWGRWLCTARGCHYECSYCGGCKSAHKRLAGRNGLVIRSPARVVDELKDLKEAGVIQASLSYDIAEMGEAYWQEFFVRLRDSGVIIGLYNEFFQLPKPAFIEAFVKSVDMTHSCVALSPLSGSERVRRLNGKHYSNRELFDTLALLHQYNACIFAYFSLNLPGEDERSFRETLELARQIYEFYPSRLLQILNTCHTIDPFSPMSLYPEKYGIQVSMSSFMDYYTYCQDTQLASREARTELHRGFMLSDPLARSLEAMADAWDAERMGKETSWWPVPPKW